MRLLVFKYGQCHADGRTDMMKLMVTFIDFANAPKNRTFTCDY